MSTYKDIDEFAVALMFLGVEIAGGPDNALEDLWNKIPTASGGHRVTKEDFMEFGRQQYRLVKGNVSSFIGGLPDVEEDDLELEDEPPAEDMHGFKRKEKARHVGPIHISGHYPQRFVFKHNGPTYGKQVLIVCNDGQQMFVNDTSRGFIISTGNRKYVAGEPYFDHGEKPGKYPVMEYYADYGTKPTECWVLYGK